MLEGKEMLLDLKPSPNRIATFLQVCMLNISRS